MRQLLALTLLVTAAIANAGDNDALLCSNAADVYHLKLKPRATVYGNATTLGDVLSFVERDCELQRQIGDRPLLADARTQGSIVVTHDLIVQRLGELGVNLARVMVGGALECQLTIQKPPQTSPETNDAAPLLRPHHSQSAGDETTLADCLRRHVDDELTELGGTAELSFERAGQEFLDYTTPPFEFKVSSSGRTNLGLREFRVVIRQDGRVQRTAHISAHVRLARQVVVAQRPLSMGNFVRRDDIQLETRILGQDTDLGYAGLAEVVGQQVTRFVPTGEMIATSAIKAVDLVRRSRPVSIIGSGPNVQVRLNGVALDSGSYGDMVRVRLGEPRGKRRELRGMVTGLGTVQLSEGGI